MNLNQKIAQARHQKGITQEELAALAKVTVRTIQRVESGESVPRMFTLKVIAAALDIPFENLQTTETPPVAQAESMQRETSTTDKEDNVNFLRLLCLSCFTYLLIPYVHFLVPAYLLKQRREQNAAVLRFACKVIREQVYWVILTTFLFLLTLAYNLVVATYFQKRYVVSYLLIFSLMYLINGIVIIRSISNIKHVAGR